MAAWASSMQPPDSPVRGSLSPTAFNARIVEEFRTGGGHVAGPLADLALILVHHIGARSGQERVVPLVYFVQPDGRLVVIASNGGAPGQPAWYHNLKANPKVTVEVGTETFQVVARELDGEERSGVWPRIVEESPAAGEFQVRTSRTIPVFTLFRQD
jgi:deazaflavin-dependent oxidoreductase (nitroreductase family)